MAVAVLMMFGVVPDPLATVTYTSATPTGKFYINGELATTTSTHTVTDPQLDFKFVADTNGDAINRVLVYLYEETGTTHVDWGGLSSPIIKLSETVTDTEWTGSGTLPAIGTYTIKGTADTLQRSFIMMSVTGTWTGSEGTFSGETILQAPAFSWLSISFLLVGVALVGVGVYCEKS